MDRKTILETAVTLTCSDRNAEYGEPYDNLSNIATLWNAYLFAKFGELVCDPLQVELKAEDVAHLNSLQKIARTMTGRPKMDTYVDAAAYAAIAGECAKEDATE